MRSQKRRLIEYRAALLPVVTKETVFAVRDVLCRAYLAYILFARS